MHCSSLLELFSGSQVSPRLSSYHTFGCPVYTLNTNLQSGKYIPKWDPRYMLGLYLGNSPRHARSVSLVLNIQTGRVSPQFHVQHDEFFETIVLNDRTPSKWKRVAGFYNYNIKQMKNKPVKKIFKREVGHQIATNEGSPVITNVEAYDEEIIPPPEGESEDPSFYEELNVAQPNVDPTNDVSPQILRRSSQN